MTSSASRLILLFTIVAATEARAAPCTKPSAKPPDGYTWFYVRLRAVQSTATKTTVLLPVLLTTIVSAAAEPPKPHQFNNSDPATTCYVAAIPKTARSVFVRARAKSFENRECEVGDQWRGFDDARPYECVLTPKESVAVDSSGAVSISGLSESDRTAIVSDLVSTATSLAPDNVVPALKELSSAYDLRRGVVCQSTLRVLNPKCSTSSCLSELGSSVPEPVRQWLTTNKGDLVAEEKREALAKTVSVGIKDDTLRIDTLAYLRDPSKHAGFGTDSSDWAVYVKTRLPGDRAQVLIDFAKTGFDMSPLKAPEHNIHPK